MSWRGSAPRGRSSYGGGGRAGGGFQSRGGRGGYNSGPPAEVLELGSFVHACEGEMFYASTNPKIPYFNAPVFLENKTSIGKVDEILGPLNQVYFTVKPQDGIVATSFKAGDKVFIGGDRLLPMERFLPKPKPPPGAAKPKKVAGQQGRGSVNKRGARGGFPSRGSFGGGGRGGPPSRGRGGFVPRGDSRGGRGGGGFGGRGGAPSRGGFTPRGRGRG